ncbi:MAG: ChaN family lipoprotein [Desulfobacterales bacterium]|nr:ChaN family lipoprotein [Desulfobacterales bacterium]
MRSFTFLTVLALIPLIYSCASAPKTVMREDPLIGKIMDTSTGKPVLFATLMDQIARHEVVYLSEKHDNPMHHAIQHRIIQDLVDSGRSPVIGFEFFSMEQTPLLLNLMDSIKAGHTPEMEAAVETRMRERLGWEDQSDEMWAYYWDLLILARDNGLTAAGLDLSSTQKRRITRKGLDKITPIEKRQIFSTDLSDPVYERYMKEIFTAVHCGMDHGRMTSRLYDTWKARNDKMALSITQLHDSLAKGASPAAPPGPIVVIMGNGHTEYGLGVVDRVNHLNPGISQLNLAITEISREPSGPDAYMEQLDLDGYAPAPPADYLWFTQRVSYEDPCERFKASLDRMKQKSKADLKKEE